MQAHPHDVLSETDETGEETVAQSTQCLRTQTELL